MKWLRKNTIVNNEINRLKQRLKEVVLTDEERNSINEYPKIQNKKVERNSLTNPQIFYRYYHDMLSQKFEMKEDDIFRFDDHLLAEYFLLISAKTRIVHVVLCSWGSSNVLIDKKPENFLLWLFEHFHIFTALVKAMYAQKIIKSKIKVPNPIDHPTSFTKKMIEKRLSEKDEKTGIWKSKILNEKWEAYNLVDIEKCPYRKELGKILLKHVYPYTNPIKHSFDNERLDMHNKLFEIQHTSKSYRAKKRRKTIINIYSQALKHIDYIYKNK